jgi:hypothetical protein
MSTESIQPPQFIRHASIETNAKGLAQVKASINTNDSVAAANEIVDFYIEILQKLKDKGVKVAE